MWDLVGNPEDRFSQNEAHIIITMKEFPEDSTIAVHITVVGWWHIEDHLRSQPVVYTVLIGVGRHSVLLTQLTLRTGKTFVSKHTCFNVSKFNLGLQNPDIH